jgi:hypothetical protein
MKKTALLILIGFIACLAVWLCWRYFQSPIYPVQEAQKRFYETNVAGTNAADAKNLSPEATNAKPANMEPLVWLIMLDEYKKFKQINQPVEFTLKLLDQNQQPVSGALVKAVLMRADDRLTVREFIKLKPGEGYIYDSLGLVSDDNGLIYFKGGSGKTVELASISKAGYESRLPDKMLPLDFSPGYRNNAKGQTVRDHSDFRIMKIFHLWKKGATDRLVKSKCSVSVEAFGTNWYGANLLTGEVNNLKSADFLFWFETIKDAGGNFARRFRYRVANGEILFDTNIYSYQAPETGYESEWDWYYEPYGKDAREDALALMRKKFYVKLRNGKIFGSITWHWSSENSVEVSGYLNPSGSRNLEPDSTKLITDPDEIRQIDEATRTK